MCLTLLISPFSMSKCNGAGYQLPSQGEEGGGELHVNRPRWCRFRESGRHTCLERNHVEKHWTCLLRHGRNQRYTCKRSLEPLHGESPTIEDGSTPADLEAGKLPPIALKQITKHKRVKVAKKNDSVSSIPMSSTKLIITHW